MLRPDAFWAYRLPEKVTIEKRGANAAAIETVKEETGQKTEMRQ